MFLIMFQVINFIGNFLSVATALSQVEIVAKDFY